MGYHINRRVTYGCLMTIRKEEEDDEASLSAMYDLIGSIISQAIRDYSCIHNSEKYLNKFRKEHHKKYGLPARGVQWAEKNRYRHASEAVHNYASAKYYLFHPNGLEDILRSWGIDSKISLTAIRQKAIDDAKLKPQIEKVEDVVGLNNS